MSDIYTNYQRLAHLGALTRMSLARLGEAALLIQANGMCQRPFPMDKSQLENRDILILRPTREKNQNPENRARPELLSPPKH